jgi:hypothetical protein
MLLAFSAVLRTINGAIEALDCASSVDEGSADSVRGVRRWHDGSGRRIEVRADGRMFCAGEFLGYRDPHGRIVGGDGTMLGTLKDSGEFYAADGQYQGRVFR